MEQKKIEVLAYKRQQLQRAIPWTQAMLAALEKEGFSLTHVRNVSGPTWFVRVAPPVPLQEGLGLAPEVLIVAVRGEVQARAINQAAEEVVQSGLRLDGNLVIVADQGARPLLARLERIGGHGQHIPWVRTEDGRWPELGSVLRQTLPLFDVYEERDAVRGAQLIGRDAVVAELRTRVVRGDAVGLFGLRKMGKTSVMRAVTDWFDPASGLRNPDSQIDTNSAGIAVVVDASVLIDRTVDATAEELRRALARRMRAAGEPMPPVRGSGLAAWKSVGEAILDQQRRLCVVIDEYDLLFEGEGGEGAVAGIGKIFRLLRGWAQTSQGMVSLVLVGRDATYLSAPEIEGVTSPLLAWCTERWIGPLEPPKATELLRKLGRRVGLEVGFESAALAAKWTGGHPLLQRQFGSALRAVTRERDEAWGAATDPLSAHAVAPFKERDAVLDVMREAVVLLHKRYPNAFTFLHDVATGGTWEQAMARQGEMAGSIVQTLINFGLVSASHVLPGVVGWYLAALAPQTAMSEPLGK